MKDIGYGLMIILAFFGGFSLAVYGAWKRELKRKANTKKESCE